MPNQRKSEILRLLTDKVGQARKLAGSQSLFEFGRDLARVYLRIRVFTRAARPSLV